MNRFLAFFLLFITSLLFWSGSGYADPVDQNEINAVIGLWDTQDHDGVIELYACQQKLCGRFYWVGREKDGSLSYDDKNPEPELRKRPLCGLQFIGDFEAKKNGLFDSGWIYSPRHGSFFSAKLTLINAHTLTLRGYFLIPALGENQTWTRLSSAHKCTTE